MKKRFIVMLMATALLASACGAENKNSAEDSEVADEVVSAASDEAKTIEESPAPAASEAAAASSDTQTTQGGLQDAINNAGISLKKSDINSNLWVLTNTSDTAYRVDVADYCVCFPELFYDAYFEPGEIIYYYATSDDPDISMNLIECYEADESRKGLQNDIQCAVIEASYDSSKYSDASLKTMGFATYDLADVWTEYQSKVNYKDDYLHSDVCNIVFFRLFDADGNVIYEPTNYNELRDTTSSGRIENLKMDPAILTNWDHAEFYIVTRA